MKENKERAGETEGERDGEGGTLALGLAFLTWSRVEKASQSAVSEASRS